MRDEVEDRQGTFGRSLYLIQWEAFAASHVEGSLGEVYIQMHHFGTLL